MTGRILFYLPILSIAYFYLFCFGATLYLGYVPQFNNPDPNNVLNELPILTVYLGFLAGMASAFWNIRRFFSSRLKVFTVLTQVYFLMALVYFDPGGMFEWFLD